MADTLSPLWELTLARMREFYREPGAVFWTFGFPVLLAIGLGIAFRTAPPEKPRIAVVVEDSRPSVTEALQKSSDLVVVLLDADSAEQALYRGKIDLVARAGKGEDGTVVYLFDGANDRGRLARLVTDNVLQVALGRTEPLVVREKPVEKRGGRYIDFLMPGLIGLNLMGSSMWGIGYSVVWERKKRALKRFMATPMRRSHYLLSFLLSRLVFMVAEVVALVAVGYLLFGVEMQGSLLDLAVASLLGVFTFSGLALLVAARPQSLEAASGLMNLVMLPMWLLSGSFFSYERFPSVVQPALRLLPLTAVNDLLRAIINEGAPLWGQLAPMGVLVFWIVGTFVVSLKIFRWQ